VRLEHWGKWKPNIDPNLQVPYYCTCTHQTPPTPGVQYNPSTSTSTYLLLRRYLTNLPRQGKVTTRFHSSHSFVKDIHAMPCRRGIKTGRRGAHSSSPLIYRPLRHRGAGVIKGAGHGHSQGQKEDFGLQLTSRLRRGGRSTMEYPIVSYRILPCPTPSWLDMDGTEQRPGCWLGTSDGDCS
jgi:hypothetical protein